MACLPSLVLEREVLDSLVFYTFGVRFSGLVWWDANSLGELLRIFLRILCPVLDIRAASLPSWLGSPRLVPCFPLDGSFFSVLCFLESLVLVLTTTYSFEPSTISFSWLWLTGDTLDDLLPHSILHKHHQSTQDTTTHDANGSHLGD